MKRGVLLYDRDCGLCSWWVLQLQRWDRLGGRAPVLTFAAIQSAEGAEWLADLTPQERLRSYHLVDPDPRRRISGGDAVAPTLGLLPFGAVPAFAASLFPPLTRALYEAITRNRSRIGAMLGVNACQVPQPQADLS